MSFNVLNKSGDVLFGVDNDESIIDAAIKHDVALSYGCRKGVCGACKCKIHQGNVEYKEGQPDLLTDKDIINDQALLCVAHLSEDITIDFVPPEEDELDIEIKTLPAKIKLLKKLNHDVVQLILKLPESEKEFIFHAGQYVEFILKDGQRRAFSIANVPNKENTLEFHIRHVPDGEFTSFVFNELKESSLVRFEGPFGSFYLREKSDKPIIMICGGTGFAPLKGLMEQYINSSSKGNRQIYFYWGARKAEDLYMENLPNEWKNSLEKFQYTPVLSDVSVEDNWQGKTGFVHEVAIKDHPDMSQFEVYMCGPPAMINAAKEEFMANGLEENSVYFDSFEFAAKK
ncbi:MAG: 2Fe-2S iron-sulfur cluster binding domain-containing protein [Methylococcales bacterium]|jgi:CDP-4-dehydro-6-deoxyglucose reductase|nr:2Fe-2S iron-sulfur cluster binding domain-containing protein [Methylococcales bacterium]